jgi:hypothetical protein
MAVEQANPVALNIAFVRRAALSLAALSYSRSKLRRTRASWSAYRRMYPLWRAFHDAYPDIAMHPLQRWRFWQLSYSVRRMVIEIHDGLLRLRPWLDLEVAERARALGEDAGQDSDVLEVTVEAALVSAALRAKSTDHRFQNPIPPESDCPGGGADGPEAIVWLTRLAHAFDRSPVVASVTRRVIAPPQPTSATAGGESL